MDKPYVKIRLTKGKYSLIDKDDLPKVNHKSWCYHSAGYACRRSNDGKIELLHRVIMNAPKGMYVDHINNEKLDNRKSNLKIVTNSENLSRSVPKKGIKGVDFHKQMKMWRARLHYHGKEISIGLFTTKKQALIAYNKAAKQCWGEHAWQNPIP